MKTIIAGSRNISDYDQVLLAVNNSGFDITEVVSGRSGSVDLNGERYAMEHHLELTYFPADWRILGRSAGPIRNTKMAKYADAAIIVWDGTSRGSANMIENMKYLNKPYYVWKVNANGIAAPL